jgi:murein DD-endopeptidase MepM/ murein hydrolase activator NlpD
MQSSSRLLCLCVLLGSAPAMAAPGVEFKVHTKDSTVTIDVYNPQFCEMTVWVDLNLQNVTAKPSSPVKLICPPQSTVQGTVLNATDPTKAWKYDYKFNFQWGGKAKFDPGILYMLPYKSGTAHKVGQGHNGKVSHFGDEKFALDFDMPVNTEVMAARKGKVVFIQDGFADGKNDSTYKSKSNFIYICHPDGTLGEYLHLTKTSMKVKVGDTVQAGQTLALSGNSGFTTGPHLHFMVFRALDGKTRESLPVRFLAKEGAGITPLEGKTYTAVEAKKRFSPPQ